MWRAFLQNNYSSLEEWIAYSDTYGLAARLGFDSAEAAWNVNPFIQGSVNPSDYKVADLTDPEVMAELTAYYGKLMVSWSDAFLAHAASFEGESDNREPWEDAWEAAIANEQARRRLQS